MLDSLRPGGGRYPSLGSDQLQWQWHQGEFAALEEQGTGGEGNIYVYNMYDCHTIFFYSRAAVA